MFSGRHEQDGAPLVARHKEFGPQGLGLQGSETVGSIAKKSNTNNYDTSEFDKVSSMRKIGFFNSTWLWLTVASYKRITRKVHGTATDWVMADNLTKCLETAGSGTRIRAFPIDTSSVLRAIRTRCAFRVTCRWRTDISCYARTYGNSIPVSAFAVRTARRRRTSFFHYYI